jgi:hypothetical protein
MHGHAPTLDEAKAKFSRQLGESQNRLIGRGSEATREAAMAAFAKSWRGALKPQVETNDHGRAIEKCARAMLRRLG